MTEYTLYINENGKTAMIVNGIEYILSSQGNLSDEAWLIKLQAKANYFASTQ